MCCSNAARYIGNFGPSRIGTLKATAIARRWFLRLCFPAVGIENDRCDQAGRDPYLRFARTPAKRGKLREGNEQCSVKKPGSCVATRGKKRPHLARHPRVPMAVDSH